MKSYLYLLLGLFLVSSCIDDKGNYNYTPIREINIKNLPDNANAILLEPFLLNPEIDTDIPPENLSYLWYVDTDTLSREKDLNYTFKNLQANSKALYFEVTDRTNGVRYSRKMPLKIITNFHSGWLILSEVEGKGYFSFLSYEGQGQLYTDLFQQIKGETLGTGPQMISHISSYNGSTNRIAIVCKGGNSAELDGNSLDFIKYYKDEFRAPDFAPDLIDIETPIKNSSSPAFYIFSSGKIYGKGGSAYDEGWYEYPLESSDALDYRVDGHLGINLSCYLVFDKLNGRYLTFRNNSNPFSPLSPILLKDPANRAFDPSHVEGECIWIGVGGRPNNDYLAVIRTPDGRYLLHILRAVTNTTTWVLEWTAVAEYEFAPGAVDDHSCFAVNTNIPYLYIGTDRQLSVLNLDAVASGDTRQAFIPLKDYDGAITTITYNYYNDYTASKITEELVLGIQTSTQPLSGELVFIAPDPTRLGEIIRIEQQVGGRIISLFYKQK